MSTSLVVRVLKLLAFAGLLLASCPIVAAEPTPTPASDSGVRPRPEEARRPPPPTHSPAQEVTEESPRVWPLPSDSYGFSQAFGCVPQLGFYAVVAGCPDEAPAFHTGIDLAAPSGTLFFAAAAGTVVSVGPDRAGETFNTLIVIVHEGRNADYASEYYHWRTAFVQPGQHVEAGQAIGEVGSVGFSTGPHLHLGVIDLISGSRIDPMRWLPSDPGSGAYLGIAPGSVAISYPDVSVGVPDYADPEPPPVPAPEPIEPTPTPEPTATETPTPTEEPPVPVDTEPTPTPTPTPSPASDFEPAATEPAAPDPTATETPPPEPTTAPVEEPMSEATEPPPPEPTDEPEPPGEDMPPDESDGA